MRSRGLGRTASGVVWFALVATLTLTGCGGDDAGDDGASGGSSSSDTADEPTEDSGQDETDEPTDEPTDETTEDEAPDGPVLRMRGVTVEIPEGLDDVSRGASMQSAADDEVYLALRVFGSFTDLTLEENAEIERRRTSWGGRIVDEPDVEIDGETFFHLSGRYSVDQPPAVQDFFGGKTGEGFGTRGIEIYLTVITPAEWSPERRQAYLDELLAGVDLP